MIQTNKAGALSTQEFCRLSRSGGEYRVIYLKSKRFVMEKFNQMEKAIDFATTQLGADREQVLFNTYL